jgi:Fe2+ transport system protein B
MLIDYEKIEKIIDAKLSGHEQEIANSFNHYLTEFRRLIDEEIRAIKIAGEEANQLEKINNIQRTLNLFSLNLQELEKANKNLHDEIKKRDAIIERKTKQIQRLKDAV